jgi:hypothetical protein
MKADAYDRLIKQVKGKLNRQLTTVVRKRPYDRKNLSSTYSCFRFERVNTDSPAWILVSIAPRLFILAFLRLFIFGPTRYLDIASQSHVGL